MTKDQQIAALLDALRRIANCNESRVERYITKVDEIAVDALIAHEHATEDEA